VKVRTNNTLWKFPPTTVNIAPNTTTTLSKISLTSGDIDQNNQLNLFDYNIMISCYGAKQCPQKEAADLNIDGKVDELDLNILYDAFSTRQGD
jgi:hypothetical protein